MLMLFEHTEYFKWKALSPGEKVDADNAPLEGQVANALVAFTTILEQDAIGNSDIFSKKAANKIYKLARQLNAETVVLYPFAHLTNVTLAEPRLAIAMLKAIEAELLLISGAALNVSRTPFGWHKQREGRTAGHEQAIMLREIKR